MSSRMQVPLNQRRHTNIAVVRYQRRAIKLELACYKNKVISFRAGTEDRLDEVLQVDKVFTNVGKGFLASEMEIESIFDDEFFRNYERTNGGGGEHVNKDERFEKSDGFSSNNNNDDDTTNDRKEKHHLRGLESEKLVNTLNNKKMRIIIRHILLNGELQVAQQERNHESEDLLKDICLSISSKTMNINNSRPFPPAVIEEALKQTGAAISLDQNVKKQTLTLMNKLLASNTIPGLVRAKMKVRVWTSNQKRGDGKADAVAKEQPQSVSLTPLDLLLLWCAKNQNLSPAKKENLNFADVVIIEKNVNVATTAAADTLRTDASSKHVDPHIGNDTDESDSDCEGNGHREHTSAVGEKEEKEEESSDSEDGKGGKKLTRKEKRKQQLKKQAVEHPNKAKAPKKGKRGAESSDEDEEEEEDDRRGPHGRDDDNDEEDAAPRDSLSAGNGNNCSLVLLIQPSLYRSLEDFIQLCVNKGTSSSRPGGDGGSAGKGGGGKKKKKKGNKNDDGEEEEKGESKATTSTTSLTTVHVVEASVAGGVEDQNTSLFPNFLGEEAKKCLAEWNSFEGVDLSLYDTVVAAGSASKDGSANAKRGGGGASKDKGRRKRNHDDADDEDNSSDDQNDEDGDASTKKGGKKNKIKDSLRADLLKLGFDPNDPANNDSSDDDTKKKRGKKNKKKK